MVFILHRNEFTVQGLSANYKREKEDTETKMERLGASCGVGTLYVWNPIIYSILSHKASNKKFKYLHDWETPSKYKDGI